MPSRKWPVAHVRPPTTPAPTPQHPRPGRIRQPQHLSPDGTDRHVPAVRNAGEASAPGAACDHHVARGAQFAVALTGERDAAHAFARALEAEAGDRRALLY